MSDRITFNKGSDVTFRGVWPSTLTAPANLSGYSISIYDASPRLAPYVSVVFIDAAVGSWEGKIEWNETIPIGTILYFRIRLTPLAGFPELDDTSTPLIPVQAM